MTSRSSCCSRLPGSVSVGADTAGEGEDLGIQEIVRVLHKRVDLVRNLERRDRWTLMVDLVCK